MITALWPETKYSRDPALLFSHSVKVIISEVNAKSSLMMIDERLDEQLVVVVVVVVA